jgi:hypothetical protein
MIYKNPISRRTLLRGIGCAMSLPWLEAMGPLTNWSLGAETDRPAPNRMAFLYVPNGKNMVDWTPTAEGANFDLPTILQPLKNVRDDIMILTGLTADKARANGDGPGDHARAMTAFLTGTQPHKTDGANIRAGISVDQVAAARLADQTRLQSLEIGCEHSQMAGGCDSGYSCVYSSTVSWRSATTPNPKEMNPRLVFERLFGAGSNGDRLKRDARKKSLLDFVRNDAGDLTNKVGAADKRKLDEYFSAVRDIEVRMDRAEKLPPVKVPDGAVEPADGVPAEYKEHLRMMCDLMVLAFQADVTRVCTFVLANEGSNRPYPFLGIKDGHHDLSHHGGDEAKKAKIRQINIFHTTQLAYLLERMKSIPEGDGTLLDHSTIAYGSGNSDGNRHNHDDLPVLLAGRACGTIKPGRHLVFPQHADTPINNLWLSMLDRVKAGVDILGDSTGRLPGLNG